MDVKVKRGIIIGVCVVVFLSAVYFTFRPTECADYTCFSEEMAKCSKANYINDGIEATWKYEVRGMVDETCEVEVTLLNMKEGELSTATLEGKSMSCFYPRGESAYPERDLSLCHGRLKEDIQEMIIKRLHGYVLSNLDEIKESLR